MKQGPNFLYGIDSKLTTNSLKQSPYTFLSFFYPVLGMVLDIIVIVLHWENVIFSKILFPSSNITTRRSDNYRKYCALAALTTLQLLMKFIFDYFNQTFFWYQFSMHDPASLFWIFGRNYLHVSIWIKTGPYFNLWQLR